MIVIIALFELCEYTLFKWWGLWHFFPLVPAGIGIVCGVCKCYEKYHKKKFNLVIVTLKILLNLCGKWNTWNPSNSFYFHLSLETWGYLYLVLRKGN